MEFSWIETFAALAEKKSIRSTASSLGISASSLSERITQLEDDLGAKLIERTAQGCMLTEAGKVYLSDAKKFLNEWDKIVRTVQNHKDAEELSLRIGVQGGTIPPVVGKFLDGFIERHPEVLLSIYSDQDFNAGESLKAGKTDLFFSYSPDSLVCSEMVHRPVFQTCIDAIIPQTLLRDARNTVSLKDLNNRTFLIYPETKDTSLHDFELDMLEKSGVSYALYDGFCSANFYHMLAQMCNVIVLIPRLFPSKVPPKAVKVKITDELSSCCIEMLHYAKNPNPALKMFLEEFGDSSGEDTK